MKDLFSIYRIARNFANLLSISNARNLSKLFGFAVYFLFFRRRKAVEDNIKIVFGDNLPIKRIKFITREIFRNFFEMIYEYLMLPRYGDIWFRTKIENPGEIEKISKLLLNKESVINISGHIGNWEFLAAYGAYRNLNTLIITAPHMMRPDTLFFEKQRKRLGLICVDMNKSAKTLLKSVKRHSSITAILSDKLYTGNSVKVDIFDRKKMITSGGFKLASRYYLNIIFSIAIKMKNGKYRLFIDGPYKRRENESEEKAFNRFIREYSILYERYVKKFPEQWYFFSPFIE